MSVDRRAWRSSQPNDAMPTTPPTADAVVSSPKPTSPMSRWSSAYLTRTPHGAAQVTLKARMTSASVRTGAFPRIHRTPSAMSWRMCVCVSRTPPGVVAIRPTSTTASATHTTWTTNGQTIPSAKRKAPTGGPSSWLAVRKPAWSRALPVPRSRGSTSIGSRVWDAESANTSATP